MKAVCAGSVSDKVFERSVIHRARADTRSQSATKKECLAIIPMLSARRVFPRATILQMLNALFACYSLSQLWAMPAI